MDESKIEWHLDRPSSSCSHGNIDHGSVLRGGDGSRDEPISRAKGRWGCGRMNPIPKALLYLWSRVSGWVKEILLLFGILSREWNGDVRGRWTKKANKRCGTRRQTTWSVTQAFPTFHPAVSQHPDQLYSLVSPKDRFCYVLSWHILYSVWNTSQVVLKYGRYACMLTALATLRELIRPWSRSKLFAVFSLIWFEPFLVVPFETKVFEPNHFQPLLTVKQALVIWCRETYAPIHIPHWHWRRRRRRSWYHPGTTLPPRTTHPTSSLSPPHRASS